MRDVSDHTKLLFEKRAKMSARKNNIAEFDRIQEEIHASSLQDHANWIEENVKEMERANAAVRCSNFGVSKNRWMENR